METRPVLGVDIETYSSVELKTCGVYRYTEAPDFTILLFSYAFDDEPVKTIDLTSWTMPDDLLAALTDPAIIKSAYNANFERTCLAKFLGLQMPPEQWRCSSVHALYMGLPGHLDGVAQCLKLEQQKDSAGKALINYFCKPCKPTKANGGRTRNLPEHDPEKWQAFIGYNQQDVRTERDVRKRLEKFPLPEAEQKLWELDQRMNDRGVKIDLQMVHRAIECSEAHKERLEAEAIKLTGLDNPNSVQQLKGWLLEAEGLEVTSLNKAAIPDLMRAAESKVTERVLEIRQELSRTSVRKYQAMERAACSDDRVRGLLQFYGANRTGRWCLAEGTPVTVRTQNGQVLDKPIETVTVNDEVWDGMNWVKHDGVVYSGDKEVISWDSITATPEHVVYVSESEKMPLAEARDRGLRLWKGLTPSID